VKTHYLIIGNGRLARHLQQYFSILNLPYSTWARGSSENLSELITAADRICLAIRDDALAEFVKTHPELVGKTVHFSGSLNISGIFSAHPLMTFGPHLYSRDTYLNMPFITVKGEPSFRELFPDLHNPAARITAEQKALYHAFCVMSGNFTTILWQNIFKDFTARLGLNRDLIEPYLQQITENLLRDTEGALTGPIARGDTATIERNLKSIAGTPYENIYYAFLNLAQANAAPQKDTNEHLGL
jgi:2-dehydropantoate 2-reductase